MKFATKTFKPLTFLDAGKELPALSIPAEVIESLPLETVEPGAVVVYSNNIPDSIYAAAQIVSGLKDPTVKLVEYQRFDDPVVLQGHDHVILCNVTLTAKAADALRGCKLITALVQRENFEAFQAHAFECDVDLVTPAASENLRTAFAHIENTATWLSFDWLTSRGLSASETFTKTRIAAARAYSLTYPVVPSLSYLDDDQYKGQTIKYKSLVFNLKPLLRAALQSKDPLDKIQKIKTDWNEASYTSNWNATREYFKRARSNLTIGRKVQMVTNQISASGGDLENMVAVSGMYTPDIVVREYLGSRTISRVDAENCEMKMVIGSSIPGNTEYWWEGPFYCASAPVYSS